MAIAAPDTPAMSAWLSLVGMPNTHAAVAQITMAKSAAHSAMSASCASPPKSTILEMVCATVALIFVITSTPKKLHTAAIRIADRGLMARVDTQVAIALGASVQPFTRMTPKVKAKVMSSAGLETSWLKKVDRSIVIWVLLFAFSIKRNVLYRNRRTTALA